MKNANDHTWDSKLHDSISVDYRFSVDAISPLSDTSPDCSANVSKALTNASSHSFVDSIEICIWIFAETNDEIDFGQTIFTYFRGHSVISSDLKIINQTSFTRLFALSNALIYLNSNASEYFFDVQIVF